ncbi:MAG: ComF family protein [Phycisphaerales bacterium]|nr:MAG: ComF family protein [Phycisphaerales bacterium]
MVRDEAQPTKAPSGKFVWPPGPPDLDAGPPVLMGETPARGRARAAAIEVERVWLGLTRPPMADRMLEAGWLPDSPDQYCPRCGEDAGPFEADFDGCPACRSKRLAWDVAVRLGCYDGLLREMILEFKHGPWRRLGQDLGRLLGLAVADRLRLMRIDPARVIVTPVPTTTRRRLSRGVDHTLVLAREVSRATGCRLVRAVGRQHGPPQSRLPMSARKGNVAGVFRARRAAARLGPERVVVVVDDVRTTGATMTGVCRTLGGGRRAGAVCWAATLGVATGEGSGSGRSGSGAANSGAGSA